MECISFITSHPISIISSSWTGRNKNLNRPHMIPGPKFAHVGSKSTTPGCRGVSAIHSPSQAESSKLKVQLDEQGEKLRGAEDVSERRGQRIEELQRLLGGMEKESAGLRETISSHEEELRSLRSAREDGQKGGERSVHRPHTANRH